VRKKKGGSPLRAFDTEYTVSKNKIKNGKKHIECKEVTEGNNLWFRRGRVTMTRCFPVSCQTNNSLYYYII